jgi:hypothetical protein
MSTLVVIEYDDMYKAEETRLLLWKLEKDALIDLEDAVVAFRDQQGNVKLNQSVSVTATDDLPLMVQHAPTGERQLISAADALLLAQISSFSMPDLSEPPLDFNGDGQSIPFRSVPSSSTCFVRPPNSDQDEW